MFEFVRHIAGKWLIVMMSLFLAALVLDEYGDKERALQDLAIETCMELEQDDVEWDEADEFVGIGSLMQSAQTTPSTPTTPKILIMLSSAHQSDALKRGLVRRYAPRKGIAAAYYILT